MHPKFPVVAPEKPFILNVPMFNSIILGTLIAASRNVITDVAPPCKVNPFVLYKLPVFSNETASGKLNSLVIHTVD